MNRPTKVRGPSRGKPRATAAYKAVSAEFPSAVVDRLVRELVDARKELASVTAKLERRRVERRIRVLLGAVTLLNHLATDAALERAAKASARLLKALDVRDMYSDADGRGDAAAKRMLMRVMGDVVVRQATTDATTSKIDLRAALVQTGRVLRNERAPLPKKIDSPSAAWPLSLRLAFDFYLFGLSDDAALAMFGPVPETAVVTMASARRDYAQSLDQNRTPRLDDLCGHTLQGAGLLTAKQRSDFDRLK